MEMSRMRLWITVWVFCSLWPGGLLLERVPVNMKGQGCFDLNEREIRDDQVYSVFATYQPNVQPSLDHCDVSIRAVERNRRLEYLVDKLTIFDCGITVWIYDNPQLVSSPTRIIKCSDDSSLPLTGKTSHNVIKVSIRKESSQAQAFDFQIQIKTDAGPPFDFERDASTFYEQPLDTGAIVGIVMAGSVFIIALAGLAIYCCLKARMNNRRKNAEASEAPSAPSVYTTGTSGVVYESSAKDQRGRASGGLPRHPSPHGPGQQPPTPKTTVGSNNLHTPDKDARGGAPYKNGVYAHKERRVYTNEAYEHEEKFDRQASVQGSQKRRQHNASFDESDRAKVKGGHVSRRDSGRGSRVRYDKKTKYSRHDDYGSVGKGKKQPTNSQRRNRSRSPNPSQGSVGSTVDSNTLVYGYSRTSATHPNTGQDTDPRSRSRSRSRSRTRAGSQRSGSLRSGSISRSRTGSVGRGDGREGPRKVPHTSRQYGDMSDFLPEQQRSRSRSASVGKRSHRR